MGRSLRRSLLSALALALAGAGAFSLFVGLGDQGEKLAARVAAEAAGEARLPAPRDAAVPSLRLGSPPGTGLDPAREVVSAPAGGPVPVTVETTEDWRTSPRLWVFSTADGDRVISLLGALGAAVRESNWKELERLSKEITALGARAVGPLLDVLLRDPDDRMRIYAAMLLGEVQQSVPGGILQQALRAHALPLLEGIAASAEDPSMRHSALVAMGRIGDPDSFGFLADSLRRAEGWPMVADTILALSSIRGDGVTGEIADLASREADPRVRERLARVLGERQDPASLGALGDLATRDADPAVRAAAAAALGRLGTPAASRALREIAGGQDEPGVRAAAVEALGRPGDAGPVDALRRVLGSGDDPEVRIAAWRALREVNTPEARRAIEPYRPAVRVEGVLPGTQAERLAFSANDVITSYNGQPVRDAGALRGLVLSTPPEQVVPLVVDRGGWTTTVLVHGGLLGIRVQDGAVLD